MLKSAFVAVCALMVVLVTSSGAHAQVGIEPPPPADTQSATGVSFESGAFSYDITDLAIGGPEPDEGLALTRRYSSNLSVAFSSGYKVQGWTHSLHASVSTKKLPTSGRPPLPGREPYLYSVSIGNRSVGFLGGSSNPTGGLVGTYTPVFGGSEKLVYSGTEQAGTFTFTDKDGTIAVITDLRVTSLTYPSGVTLTYNYDGQGLLKSIFSTRGYALLFEGAGRWTKACAVNLSEFLVTAFSACPAGVQSVSYGYSPDNLTLTSATNRVNQIAYYEYVSAGSRNHLSCVKPAGTTSCSITNQYNICQRDPTLTQDPPGLREMDQVIWQGTATGETFTYSFPANPVCPKQTYGNAVTITANDGTGRSVITNKSGSPTSLVDELGRQTLTTYPNALYNLNSPFPNSVAFPEGNSIQYQYDGRKNLVQGTMIGKPGSAVSDIISSASYPTTCTTAATCNKPTSFTDARGYTTTYGYYDFGEIKYQLSPPDQNGISPGKFYSYAQRYAWVKSASGYSPAGAPIWVLTSESNCRTSAMDPNSGACASGSADQVVTTYDYGPDGGPNVLLIRGRVVSSAGTSLRTCYGYDSNGNKIFETSPRAGLSVCQ